MEKFKLVSEYSPMGDQPAAIKQLVDGIRSGKKEQVLLGGTGTGKTFTVANVIEQVNKPTLVLAHNKTLAGQLYSELKEFFPENRVEYFVSNFDFYQPEAYIPKSDTYIDKNAQTNYEIEMLRSSAMNSLLERRDTIVVASVASIYGLGNPEQYKEMIFSPLKTGSATCISGTADAILKKSDILYSPVKKIYFLFNVIPFLFLFKKKMQFQV